MPIFNVRLIDILLSVNTGTDINDWATESYLVLAGYQVSKCADKSLWVIEKDACCTDFYT